MIRHHPLLSPDHRVSCHPIDIAQGCKAAGFDVGNPIISGSNSGNTGATSSAATAISRASTTVIATPSTVRSTSAIVTSTSSAARSGGSGDNSGSSDSLSASTQPNGATALRSSMVGVVVGIGAIFAGVL